MTGNNPLIGPNLEEFGPRFPPMSDAYCPRLRRLVYEAAKKMSIPKFLHEGIYVFVSGPSYESKAECRFLRSIGADVVGMSTIPEVIVARHCNIKVLGLSLVTNMVVMNRDPRSDPDAPSQEKLVEERAANHEEVLAAANSRAKDLQVRRVPCNVVETPQLFICPPPTFLVFMLKLFIYFFHHRLWSSTLSR